MPSRCPWRNATDVVWTLQACSMAPARPSIVGGAQPYAGERAPPVLPYWTLGSMSKSYRCFVDQMDGFTENEKKGTRDSAPEISAVQVWRRMAAYGTIPFRTGPRTSQRRDVEKTHHVISFGARLAASATCQVAAYISTTTDHLLPHKLS